MTKILSKIERRNNSNELPRRNELVEMDLFDTDRNPWPGDISGDIWKRYDYDFVSGFLPYWNPSGPTSPVVTEDLVVERLSLALLFVGGTFNVVSGVGLPWTNTVHLQLNISNVTEDPLVWAAAQSETGTIPIENVLLYPYDSDYRWTVLHPGTYQAKVFAWVTDAPNGSDGSYGHPAILMTMCAATAALLPVGELPTSGWGGELG